MSTYTSRLYSLLNQNGVISKDNIDIGLDELTDNNLDNDTTPNDYAFGYDGTTSKFSSVQTDLTNIADVSYFEEVFDSITGNVPVEFNTLFKIENILNSNDSFYSDVKNYYDLQRLKIFEGDGTTTNFEIFHTSGNIDVWVNGYKLQDKVVSSTDTSGTNNLTSGNYDYHSEVAVNSGQNSLTNSGFIDGEPSGNPWVGYTNNSGTDTFGIWPGQPFYNGYWYNNYSEIYSVLTGLTVNVTPVMLEFIETSTGNLLDYYRTKYQGPNNYMYLIINSSTIKSAYGPTFDRPESGMGAGIYVNSNLSPAPNGSSVILADGYDLRVSELGEAPGAQYNAFSIVFATAPSAGDKIVVRSY